jgi:hypothetical protein
MLQAEVAEIPVNFIVYGGNNTLFYRQYITYEE